MPRAKKIPDVKKPIEEKKRALAGLLSLAAMGEIIKLVERDGPKLKVTYRNGVVETFTFQMAWQAVYVVMVMKDMQTCQKQAELIQVVKERPAPKEEK